ncbi:MAG TPA: FAD-dependent oxidoreductase, partial [Pirellulales bacterium]
MPIRSTLRLLLPAVAAVLISHPLPAQEAQKIPSFDVIVYGGTAGGVAAAVQTARMGKTALIIEPGEHLGGLTSGGLGATDIGNKGAIGGISREFYQRVKKYYENDAVWRQQKRTSYKSGRGADVDEAMWTFEPHVAEKILNDFVKESGVQVVYKERLDRKTPLVLNNGKIDSIKMESGKLY